MTIEKFVSLYDVTISFVFGRFKFYFALFVCNLHVIEYLIRGRV
jgi:hypothetical protein